MKKLLQLFALVAAMGLGLFASAYAETYPVTNPTYIPNARGTAFTVASNVAATPLTLNGIGTVALQLSGTCTGLQGRMQGTVDDTNYVTLNMYPYNATLAASAVTSVSGTTGTWVMNTAGYSKVRMNNTGVSTSTCVGRLVGSSAAFALPR